MTENSVPETKDAIARDYRERAAAHRRQAVRLRSQAVRVAWARLAVFAAGIWVAWEIWETTRLMPGWIALPIGVFSALMWRHARLDHERERAERGARLYDAGIERLEGTWKGKGLAGDKYRSAEHPYSGDLDLFGSGSLYELLATTPSRWGADRLADWLSRPAPIDVVRDRQLAVRELAPRLDLRESVAVEASGFTEPVDVDSLQEWATSPAAIESDWARWPAFVLGIVSLTLTIAWLAGYVPRAVAFACWAGSGLFAMMLRDRIGHVIRAVEKPSKDLGMLLALVRRLEDESFDSERLRKLQAALKATGDSASKEIETLSRLVEWLDARRNQVFMPIAALLLWGTQLGLRLEAFRRRVGPRIPAWLDSVAELDALLALATYGYEHPDDPFPELVPSSNGADVFDARGLGHPLIPDTELVRNDLEIGADLRLVVVSGSNMSGKSTLLRSVGVNVILALAGAPVRARSLRMSPFRLSASIRVQDSLEDGISFFYAEILRLRQIVEMAPGEPTMLFLLDEILQGTNSHDRRIGADAVVRTLVEKGAVGLITTHDLALAKLADSLEDRARNIHFVDHIQEGKIQFDYRIHDGVVTKSNALELMRSVGLKV